MIVARDGHYGIDALLRHVLDTAPRRANQESCRELRRLRAEREAFDLTLREFAPMLGTSPSRLSSYENGSVARSVAIARPTRTGNASPDRSTRGFTAVTWSLST